VINEIAIKKILRQDKALKKHRVDVLSLGPGNRVGKLRLDKTTI
jgi:hypothetical protein